jgi:adenine-specific DNA-methyltransferase
MADNKQKLELTWIGKNNPEFDISNIEPRILEENPELSNCTNDPNTENMIIHGDNLLALKALLPEYEGKIKCIYIDPPYNTGNAFEHYDDNVEHSLWLSLMKPRLELLKMLLSDDGVIYINIDIRELAYLKIICDEIFGRDNFLSQINSKAKSSGGVGQEGYLFDLCEYILVYAKDVSFVENYSPIKIEELTADSIDHNYSKLFLTEGLTERLFDIEGGTVGKVAVNQHKDYKIESLAKKNRTIENISKNFKILFRTTNPQGGLMKRVLERIPREGLVSIDYIPSKGRNAGKLTRSYFLNGGLIVWFKDSAELRDGKVLKFFKNDNLWIENLHQGIAKEGNVEFPQSKKPEKLIQKILSISTQQGDFVLDSFLGSGTSAAVAHKMGRNYIGIEMGNHAYTHCKKRLDLVISGEDSSGISKSVRWDGGGAYKFYELAPSFITIDEFGNQVIDSYFNDTKLIRAMCKLLNFEFKPSQSEYWKHGIGQGNNYIYVTTQILSVGIVQQIKSYLKPTESITICAKKFEPGCESIDSKIIVKKIPQSILNSCQFGKKEYLLPIREEIIDDTEESELD